MFIILEGPDGAGKSTLASELSKRLGAQVCHHGPYKGVDGVELGRQLLGSMKPALEGLDLILDRCWLSEPIYAEEFRRLPSRLSNAHLRMLERAALQAGAVVVVCRPRFEKCAETFLSGRDEYMDNVDELKRVWDRYAPGHIVTSLPVIYYDFEEDILDDLLERVAEAATWYNMRSTVQLIGDRPNLRTHAQLAFHVPFVSFAEVGCSGWLAEKLDEAGIPESALSWYNAFLPDGSPASPAVVDYNQATVALGRNAARWCSENKIPHVSCPHPQVHKRFHHDKPYELFNLIKEMMNG